MLISLVAAVLCGAWAAISFARGQLGDDVMPWAALAVIAAIGAVVLWMRSRAQRP